MATFLYIAPVALFREVGIEAQPGDQVSIYLDKDKFENPETVPTSILGVIQNPITTVCNGKKYTVEYDVADLEGSPLAYIESDDVGEVFVKSEARVLFEAEEAARIAADVGMVKAGQSGVSLYWKSGGGGFSVSANATDIASNNPETVFLGTCVTGIGNNAFIDCDTLTSITIPSSVVSIGDYAFTDCNNLASVTLPTGLISIGSYAFRDCSVLTDITLPNTLTTIGEFAFADCGILRNVTVPGSVATVGNEAFSGCGGLESVVVSEGVVTVGAYSFNECNLLTSVTLPASLRSIQEEAFSYCINLASINIPSGVTSIGDAVFFNCHLLKTINCRAPKTAWTGTNALPLTFGITLHVLASDASWTAGSQSFQGQPVTVVKDLT